MNNNATLSMNPLTMLVIIVLTLVVSLQQFNVNAQAWAPIAWPDHAFPDRSIPDRSIIVKEPRPSAANPAVTLDAFTADLAAALVTTADQTDILPLTADSFYMSEWWGDWETMPDTTLSTRLGGMHLTGNLSLELVPNAGLWFMGNLNPYTDLLPTGDVEAVYLTHGWSADGDAQALMFITAADNGGYEWGGMIFTQTGFMR